MVEDKIKTLQKALEQKALSAEDIVREFEGLDYKTKERWAVGKWVSLEDVKELFSAFQRDQTARLEQTIKNLVPQKQYYDFEVKRLLTKVFDETLADKIVVDKVEYDKQVHPSRKQLLTIRNEVHVGLCANAEAKLNKLLSGSEETK